MYGAIQECIQSLVRKPKGKRPSGSSRCRWEDNIKMNFRKVGCDPGDWIALAEYRDQWQVALPFMNFMCLCHNNFLSIVTPRYVI